MQAIARKPLWMAILVLAWVGCSNPSAQQAPANPPEATVDHHAAASTALGGTITKSVGAEINDIFQAPDGVYWFATNADGAFRYDGTTLLQFTTQDGLRNNQVFSIQADKAGNIWLLTVDGVNRFDGKSFMAFPNLDMQAFKYQLFAMHPDDLWFAVGGGAYCYDGKSFNYLPLPVSDLDPRYVNPTDVDHPESRKLSAYSIYCAMTDRKGNAWFGTQTLGVCRFDGKSFTWFSQKGLSGPAVRALFEDSKGNIWMGNNGGGLFRYDGKHCINFTEEKGLSNPEFVKTGALGPGTLARVWSVAEDNAGNLWIGTYDAGAWRYDGQNLTNFTTKDGLVSDAVNTIFKDQNGELWFGTDGAGLCRFNAMTQRFSEMRF
jgi:ligand-binding sensor domain-containing protein